MIEIKNLYKSFNQQIIFSNFNYQFLNNQFYLIFGYSGCGKTTLINMIMKIVSLDSGTIIVDGIDINKLSQYELQSKIAYLTQDSYFIDYLTIKEHLQIYPDCYEKILNYLEKFQLLDLLDRYPDTLSGGEKQRISIIRELSIGKKIFILDEPTSSLDKENKVKVFNMLKQISEDTLVICVSHDEEAKMYAHEILNLNNKMEDFEHEIITPNNEQVTEIKHLKLRSAKELVFRKKEREKKSKIILCSIMITFILFISYCLNPTEKLINSLGEIYHLNYLNIEVKTKDIQKVNAMLKKNTNIIDIVYQYSHGGDYHDPLIEGVMETNETDIAKTLVFPTLPLSESFYYKDHLIAGDYFDEAYEIMLGYEYAEKLSINLESLIGKEIQLETGYGIEKFKISGIFDRFDNEKLEYFKGGYDILNINQLAYFNEKYSLQYLKDNQLSLLEKQKPYRSLFTIYFKNFSDLIDFQKQYGNQKFYSDDSIYVHPVETYVIAQINQMKRIEMIGLPVAIIAIFISLLFYIQINYVKLNKNIKEFAVYQYYGYTWKEIRNAYVMLYSFMLFKMILISTILSFIIIYATNYLNYLLHFSTYTIFSLDLSLLIFSLVLFVFGTFFNFSMIQKFRNRNWYDDVKKERDLL